MATAAQFLSDYLRKAATGAGSRGGHVIGTTRSGKPIYGEGHTAYGKLSYMKAPKDTSAGGGSLHGNREHIREAFSNYSSRDHTEAAHKHRGQAQRASNKLKASGYQDKEAYRAESFHSAASQAHKHAGKMMAAQARNPHIAES